MENVKVCGVEIVDTQSMPVIPEKRNAPNIGTAPGGQGYDGSGSHEPAPTGGDQTPQKSKLK